MPRKMRTKKTKKRTTYRGRRRTYKSKLTAPLSKREYSYVERIKLGDSDPAGGGGIVNLAFSPSYSNIPGYVGGAGPNTGDALAFQNLYDEYILWKYVIEFRPKVPNPDQTYPVFDLYSVVDYNDTANLASVAAALEYANVKVHKANKGFKRTVYPRIPLVITDISGNPFITPSKPRWISTVRASQIVPHLGLKVISDPNNSATPVGFEVMLTMYIKFKTKS